MLQRRSPVQDVRRLHRRLVLAALRDHGPQPRADLARRLGLSATTMTKVVGQLLDEGVVTESAQHGPAQRVGRPSTHVAIRPDAAYVLGVQVGAGAVHLGLCDLFARAHHTASFTFDVEANEPTAVIRSLVTHTKRLLRRAGIASEQVLGIGVAAPGPVDPEYRRNVLSINLGWRDVAFSDQLEQALDLPTVVDHNVRSMALAEATYGDGEHDDPLLYVYVRTGVGAGVVIDGQPFRPGAYGVTELGHLRVVEKGRRCACGDAGCLETVVSEPYLEEQANLLDLTSDGPLTSLMHAVQDGDQRAAAVVEDLVDHLTTGLASAVNLLNPRLILLGGMFDDAPEPLLDRIRASLHDKTFPLLRDTVRMDRSTLGPHAGVAGGAAVALAHFFYA